MGKSSIGPQIFAAMSASLILLCGGFHYGWTSSLLMELHASWSPSPIEIHFIVLALIIGNICGALLGLILVCLCGRKMTLLLMTVPFVISCLLIVFARHFWWFYPARFLDGIGIGVTLMVTPMYIGEIAEGRIRGSLCALIPVMMQIGDFVSQMISPWLARTVMGIVGAIIPIVFATIFIWVPESPYYYSMKRNANETRKSVAWLRGTSDVSHEVEEIDKSIALNGRRGINFINLFRVPSNRKALLVVVGLMIALTLPDILMTFHYSEMFSTDFSHGRNFIYNEPGIVNLIRLVISISIVFLVDRVGRRPLLRTSALLCLPFLIAKAVHSQLMMSYPGNVVSDTPWLSEVAIIGYWIGHSIGLGTLPFVMAAELFPCEVKALALALSTLSYFGTGLGVSILFSVVLSDISRNICFFILAACHFVIAIFVYFVVPETARRSLNEIQVTSQRHFTTQF